MTTLRSVSAACIVLVACRSSVPPILSSYGRTNDGIDIGGKVGDPVIASYDGVVSHIDFDPKLGFTVGIRHRVADGPAGRRWTQYANLRSVDVARSLVVARGRKIGEIGVFAGSGGVPHVRWQLCMDSTCTEHIDPTPFTDGCISNPRSNRLTYPVKC